MCFFIASFSSSFSSSSCVQDLGADALALLALGLDAGGGEKQMHPLAHFIFGDRKSLITAATPSLSASESSVSAWITAGSQILGLAGSAFAVLCAGLDAAAG